MEQIRYSKKMPLKRPPKYGVCLWWPDNGTDWVHRHDLPKAKDFVPGNRVLKRTDFDDEFSLLHYGETTVRVRPIMWLPIKFEGFDVGDPIQVRSLFGKNESFIGTIHEMIWDSRHKRIKYQLARSGRIEHRFYFARDLLHVEKINSQLRQSESQLDMNLAHKRQLAQDGGASAYVSEPRPFVADDEGE